MDAKTSNARVTSGKQFLVPFGYCRVSGDLSNKLVVNGLWGRARGRCGPKSMRRLSQVLCTT